MASPSDPSRQEAAIKRQRKGPPIKFLLPLIYAPALPLIRLSLRKNPVLRDRLFTLVLAGAFAHGMYLVYPFQFACIFCVTMLSDPGLLLPINYIANGLINFSPCVLYAIWKLRNSLF
ncbi:hypothetical protein I3760_03G230600 [Carya illinoinensis]|uniref:Uncharacterized protein n=1 Tax=Carya illinoinensis TaxID=32201 RepID=A0A922FN70_CARIL|nr:hypothetical protein I3760_03G230600 [Carya illinoinensis]KAG6723852.1 hypothetical protein I3842_03G228100 [Carya illinoinensis]